MQSTKKEKVIIYPGKPSNRIAPQIYGLLKDIIGNQFDLKLGQAALTNYDDGNPKYQLIEEVKNNIVVIIHCGCEPVEINALEMAAMCHSAQKNGAKKIILVPTFFPFRRTDKDNSTKDFQLCVMLELMCDIIKIAGVTDVITFELHNTKKTISWLNPIPVHEIKMDSLILQIIKEKNIQDYAWVAADTTGLERIDGLTKILKDIPIVGMNKFRPLDDVALSSNIRFLSPTEKCPKIAIVKEDEINTASTFREATEQILKMGFKQIYFFSAHGVYAVSKKNIPKKTPLSKVIERITRVDALKMLYTTDSIEPPYEITQIPQIKILDSAPLFAEKIAEVLKT